MKKVRILFSILLLSYSCIKEIEIPFPDDNPRQVINCLFTEGENFKVEITNSIPILNEEFDYINNATVVLFENDVEIETLQYQGTTYNSSVPAQPNKTYKLKASATGFDQIITQDRMPNTPNISQVSLIEEAYIDTSYGSYVGQFSFVINDDASQTNYYELELIRTYKEYNLDEEEIRIAKTYCITTSNPAINKEIEIQKGPSNLVFSDAFFNGTHFSLTVDFWNHYNYDDAAISYKIVIRSISKNYYLYKRRLNRHTEFQEGYVQDIFIEPIQMFTNVENGFGIFAGYNEYSQIFYH